MERAPIIVIMGHIDHGKSTLLDYIRKTKVVESEAGGITQHVSAYEIIHAGKKITFIDTPGHEAFSSMREQGAAVADIAILVVSAEDGVKPQTLEAKTVIEKNKLPYVVAISKADKPNANLERTKKSLSENHIFIEGLGGEIPSLAISAKTGEGVNELLDLLLLVAEVAELKQVETGTATGFILEAKVDPKRGVSATVIIKNGTLRRGDHLVTTSVGNASGDCFRIKKLENFLGEDVNELSASSPAVVSGWNEVPLVGGQWQTCQNKNEAESLAESCQQVAGPDKEPKAKVELSPTDKVVPIVLKADAIGTLEALKKEVGKIVIPGVRLQILKASVGAITEGDVKLASAKAEAIILGFHIKTEKTAKDLALKYNLAIANFDIIYKLSEWLAVELEKRRPVVEVETIIGSIKVIKLFSQSKNKQIIGGLVLDGHITNRRPIRIKRRDVILGLGEIQELREQQAKVDEVVKGKQFGALVESKLSIANGDILEVFQIEKK